MQERHSSGSVIKGRGSHWKQGFTMMHTCTRTHFYSKGLGICLNEHAQMLQGKDVKSIYGL